MLICDGVDIGGRNPPKWGRSPLRRNMRIGIIGAGEIGGTLTRRLPALGHHVSVANSRGLESLAELAAETGAKPVSVAEAATSGEVIIVTIPEKNILKL